MKKKCCEQKDNIICLMGPTASGKTDLAFKLVEQYKCEIISVDSAMIYRDMNIGTAKPSETILKQCPHHLIDMINVNESYSVAQFLSDASKVIEKVLTLGHTPLLVGGTMMYFNALQKGLAELPAADQSIRKQLLIEAENKGWDSLHARLEKLDPNIAKKIHPNDPQRLLRALEVYEVSGKPMSELLANTNPPLTNANFINIALAPTDRNVLHHRIALRFQQMLEQGFIDEVKALHQQPNMHPDLPSMRSVGYRQAWQYLDGELTYDEMVERSIIATRQLAKRQLTWLRGWEGIHWLDSESATLFEDVCALIES